MTLKELKHSLDKMGHDDDGSHVMLAIQSPDGESQLGLLCGVALVEGMAGVILTDDKVAIRIRDTGSL